MPKTKTFSLKQVNWVSLIALAIFFFPLSAQATDRTDVLVGLKTLPMLDQAISPPVVVGIVYDPNSATSKADAEAISSVFDGTVKTPDGQRVTGLLIPISELGKLSQVKMTFIAQGVDDHLDAIAQAASAQNVLTMSTDLKCVRTNKCVLGIVSEPAVEIYFSRAASETSKIGFDSAFTMLIKKV